MPKNPSIHEGLEHVRSSAVGLWTSAKNLLSPLARYTVRMLFSCYKSTSSIGHFLVQIYDDLKGLDVDFLGVGHWF